MNVTQLIEFLRWPLRKALANQLCKLCSPRPAESRLKHQCTTHFRSAASPPSPECTFPAARQSPIFPYFTVENGWPAGDKARPEVPYYIFPHPVRGMKH